MIRGVFTVPGLAFTFLCLFCTEVKDAGGLRLLDQRHSSKEDISILDVLEQRFPDRARRSFIHYDSSHSRIQEGFRTQTPGIMQPQARKLNFAPGLHEGNEVENLFSGVILSEDREKITYDHHAESEKKIVNRGFSAQMNRSGNTSVIPARSESKESLNLTSEESVPYSVTEENVMTQTQTPLKLVVEKNSTKVEISTGGAKNTTTMSLLSPSSRLQLIRPTPSPTSRIQIVPNNETSFILEKNDDFISKSVPTTQLKGPVGYTPSLSLNETTTAKTMSSPGSMSPDQSSSEEMHNNLSLSPLQTLFRDEDLDDLEGLFSLFFENTKTRRPEIPLSSVLPSSNETTTTLGSPQLKYILETKPKSSFMATIATTGILFISVLMLLAFVSQVFFSTFMMTTKTTTPTPEMFVPSNFSPTLNAMARGGFSHPTVQFKQPPRFIHLTQDRRRRISVRGNKIISSELFLHPFLPLRILQLGRK